MPDTNYLGILDVEALHVFIMEKTGDIPAQLRDRGLLEAAVMRPQMAAYYEEDDLIQQAAILAIGISQAQAFVQGNKRTALIAADAFLQSKGYIFAGDPLEISKWLIQVATSRGSADDAAAGFTEWLRTQVVPIAYD